MMNYTFIEIQRPIHQNLLKQPLKQKGNFHRNCQVGTFIENEPRGGLLYGNQLKVETFSRRLYIWKRAKGRKIMIASFPYIFALRDF